MSQHHKPHTLGPDTLLAPQHRHTLRQEASRSECVIRQRLAESYQQHKGSAHATNGGNAVTHNVSWYFGRGSPGFAARTSPTLMTGPISTPKGMRCTIAPRVSLHHQLSLWSRGGTYYIFKLAAGLAVIVMLLLLDHDSLCWRWLPP